ncbi:MAG: hypothetical protein COU08_03775 [Candidatus Harrisonbacteria bacterium CG10_big_fil_rev_8_21_14_0_10_42_17]|uniref:Phosphoribosyltransferase domain-containing protein n=1 Tax=Candidatus Harrisonbacteria bacterium CG10_big_fil_rev_8_21_14_0_10_42_17 TaxID=1974584 RepID=A0A2M6WHF8_9BACT|nr:MAG: hypothetical protein COU08_03775 [Candidatus Harrisonbacteria bacterium CG10_big_fil_rev_8_21_14_0_10_42_17]
MFPILRTSRDILLDILFPPLCLLCEATLSQTEKRALLCTRCVSSVSLHATLFCSQCRARLPDNRKTCHKDTRYILAAATNYHESRIQELIWQLKYAKRIAAAVPLAHLVARYCTALSLDLTSYSFFPMPLHPSRERARGFNQSELIAELVSENLHLPFIRNAFQRTRKTLPQAELPRYEHRLQNVAECFSVRKPDLVRDKNIIVLDDVSTSGATMTEAVGGLKSAGAKRVIGLVVAKT